MVEASRAFIDVGERVQRKLFRRSRELNRVFAKTEQRPKLLRDMRHERMQQPHPADRTKSMTASADLFSLRLAENVSLGRFNKPVAIVAPEKIVETLRDHVELVFAIRRLDCVDRFIQPRQHFDGIDRKRLNVDFRCCIARPCI